MLFHSTKYDGSLHYRFEVDVVHEEPGFIAVYTATGVPMVSYRGSWPAKNHMLGLYWPDRPWNLLVSWTPPWVPRSHYVNIATPATWSDGVLRCCDLDLDLILPHGKEEVVLDDEDEFDLHRAKWAYPDDLVAQCRASCDEITAAMLRPEPLFDGRLLAWRPGLPLPSLEAGASIGR